MGGGRVAGDGERAWPAAGTFVGHRPERLFDRLPVGGRCGSLRVAVLGLASHVLDRGRPSPACFLYPVKGQGSESLEQERCTDGAGNCRYSRGTLENFSVSGSANDHVVVPLKRYAGPLPPFSSLGLRIFGGTIAYIAMIYNVG